MGAITDTRLLVQDNGRFRSPAEGSFQEGEIGRAGAQRGLLAALERLDRLVDWERADRSPETPGARGVRRLDLEPMRDLVERLASPHRAFRAVHVAGTKGKGSVASLVAAGLGRAGLRAGLYTSPHVECVHERIAIAGRPVGDEPLARTLGRALDAHEAAVGEGTGARAATWFDVLTAAAFLAFAEAEVEIAAVECGLGGRLDSTNVIDGAVCVITNVDLEHTAILGATREAIAAEKSGIVARGSRVVTGLDADDPAASVLRGVVERLGASIVHAPPAAGATIEQQNRNLAGLALDALGAQGIVSRASPTRPLGAWLLDRDTVRRARLPGRLERFRVEGVSVVLDGAHVPGSLEAVLGELSARPGLGRPPTVVLGLRRDKDASGLLKVLSGRVDRVICSSVGDGPYLSAEELLQLAGRLGVAAETAVPPRVAFQRALRHAQPDGWVLVTGSLHLVGALRGHVQPRSPDPTC